MKMISPRKQNAAGERTPPVQHHPMILRSACRVCECTADNSVTPIFSQSSEKSRRYYRKNRKRVNGNLHCPQNTHYSEIKNTSEENQSCRETINFDQVEDFTISNSSEILQAWNVTKLEGDISLNLTDKQLCKSTKQSSAYVRQKSDITSKNLILEKNSVFYKSFFKRIISGTSSAIKHSYLSAVKDSLAIKNKDSSANNLSGYSAKSETAVLNHANRVGNCLNESMSRTRLETRKTIESVRHLHSINTDGIVGNVQSASVTADELRSNRLISKEFHAAEHKTKEDFAIHSRRNYQNSDVSQGSLLSHSFRSVSEDCNAEGIGLSPNQRSDKMFLSYPQEQSSYSTLTLNKSSRLSLAGWLLEASRWLFWKCIYHNICEVLLFDSWILSRSRSIGKKKILFLLLLFLLTYLLLGRFSENGESQLSLHSGHLTKFTRKFSSFFSYYLSSLFYSVEGGNEYIQTKDENPASLESWFHFWNIFDRKVLNDPKKSNLHSIQNSLDMVVDEGMNEEKMKSVAQEIFKEESSQLMKQLDQKYQVKFAPNEQASELKSLSHQVNTVHSQYQFLSDSLHNLKLEVNRKLGAQNAESTSLGQMVTSKLGMLEDKIKALEALLVSTKECCKNHSDYIALIDSHFKTLLKNVMEGKADSDTPILTAFRSWLGSNFVNHKELSDEIATIVSRMHGDYMEFSKAHFEKIAKEAAETIIAESVLALKKDIMNEANDISTLTHSHKETLSVADIKKIVKDAILLYDADKIGLVDYALESGGGSVVSTRCSETYNAGTARLSVLGFPLWFISNSPRTAIQPDMQPGHCWAFKGSQGFLVIQLSATVRPTGFSLEHIPEVLSPSGTIDSAPREVSIWGLSSERDNDGVLLAEYEYNRNGEPLQYIPVKKTDENFYSYIELKILSNWGNQRFTCLYRFRVHGSRL